MTEDTQFATDERRETVGHGDERGDPAERQPIISLDSVSTHFPRTEGLFGRELEPVRAVDGVTFDLHRNEILGLVGESGSGKSTVARTIMHLESPTSGTVEFDGQPVAEMDEQDRTAFRRRVQMVFQETQSSFDPRMTIGAAIAEPMAAHGLTDSTRLQERTAGLLEQVGLSAEFSERYPHQLSGGEKQRAALARALSLDPDVLVLDEPVSALDVSVQARILDLIEQLRRRFDLSILLITHDMGVIRQLCTRVAVMYLGEIVEIAPARALFEDPHHPYTRALLEVIPEPTPTEEPPAITLSGSIPDPIGPPPGCRFHTRCPSVIAPPDLDVSQDTWRSIYDLRVAVRDGEISLTSIREQAAERATGEASTPSARAAVIREMYGIPRSVSDPVAEQTLSDAIQRLVEGDQDGADRLLADAFSAVCEEAEPEMSARGGMPDEEVSTMETRGGGSVSCHLHASDTQQRESEESGRQRPPVGSTAESPD